MTPIPRLVPHDRPLWKDLILLIAKSLTTVLTFILILVLGGVTLAALWEGDTSISDGSCTIAVLPVEGAILPFSGLAGFDLVVTPSVIEDFMDAAEADPSIEGVLVEINSPGGTPVASHRVSERLHNSSLPVVGLIGDIGASGGYMVAAATDFLIASPMSDVGSIGVNGSYVENSQQNKEEGLTYVQLVTGEFKDTGSPDKPITDEERALLQQDLDDIHDEFVDIVSEYRELDRAYVASLADGSSMPGRRAEQADLVDAVGDRDEARSALAALLQKTPDEITFCEYQAPLLPI